MYDFNATLASVLPHAVYLSCCFLLWKFARPAVTYLADDTYATPILSTFYPVFGSVAVLQRRALMVSGDVEPEAPPSQSSTPSSSSASGTSTPSSLKSAGLGFASPLTSPTAMLRVGGGKRRTSSSHTNSAGLTSASADAAFAAEELDSDVNAAVQYWVVFGVVTATYTFLSYIPVVGSYTSSLHAYASPVKLFFFLWLHLPMDATEVRLTQLWSPRIMLTHNSGRLASSSQLLYRYLCPLALQFADKTTGKGARRRTRRKKRRKKRRETRLLHEDSEVDTDESDDEEEEEDAIASIISKVSERDTDASIRRRNIALTNVLVSLSSLPSYPWPPWSACAAPRPATAPTSSSASRSPSYPP